MHKYPSRRADQFVIRLPDGWRDTIKDVAAKHHRTMNGEILAAIETGMAAKGVQLETEKTAEVAPSTVSDQSQRS